MELLITGITAGIAGIDTIHFSENGLVPDIS